MYAVVSKWANLVPDDIERYKAEQKDGLHLRSYPHIQNLVDLGEKYIQKFESKK